MRHSRPTRIPPIALLLLSAAASAAAAQEPEPLTPTAAEAIADFYNDPATIRLVGETWIAAGTEVRGDLASLGGPLTVAGTIRGDVLVINGDIRMAPAGRILGSLVVVGGSLQGDSTAISGAVTRYREPLRFRRQDDRLVPLPAGRAAGLTAGATTWFGRTDFLAAIEGSYNRVEGLPIMLGPRLELGHSNPTVLDARVVYRTQSGLRVHPEELGYRVGVEQFLGGHRTVSVGAGLHSAIDPIELNGVSDTENSLSTFILHRDYRDHYEREGWNAFLRIAGRTVPYEARIEYRSEEHETVGAREPWSLLDNDEPWRDQPQVAEGDLRAVSGWFRWDTRNDRTDPATGWLIDLEVEQGLEGELRTLEPGFGIPEDPPVLVPRPVAAEFTALRLDLRRYLRISPRARLALRGVLAGSPDDGPLPPQRQHALGGEGTLPGYDRFQFDCGAREPGPVIDGFYPYYGCDRMILLQGELRLGILSEPRLGERLGLDFDLLGAPELVFFGDAGRAWIEAESLEGRYDIGPRTLQYDAGLGVRLGRLGIYLAVPLSEGGDGANFFLRLGPRI